jgi:glucosamine-6-phosphate deaminase
MLEVLQTCEGIDWSKVTCFHLDEYVGVSDQHPASFQKYLKERFADKLTVPLAAFHYVQGGGDPLAECTRLNALIVQYPIDVAFVGVGENGHLAFNDPPCNMVTQDPYIVVDLDEACRNQQLGEGWFATMDDVPKQAISMSMNHILKSKVLVTTVPDSRKSTAMKNTLQAPISPAVPASYLREHPNNYFFLDMNAAEQLIKPAAGGGGAAAASAQPAAGHPPSPSRPKTAKPEWWG